MYIAWLPLLPLGSRAVVLQPIQIPYLDLSSFGRTAFTGDFEALSLYQYAQQSSKQSIAPYNGNSPQSILQQLPNGEFFSIGEADSHIQRIAAFVTSSNESQGLIVVGNFTKVGGVDAQGIALVDPSTKKFTSLPGVKGTVRTVLADGDTNSFYIGGDFVAGKSSGVLAWKGKEGWSIPPFGLDGVVNSIVEMSDGSLVLGGKFSEVFYLNTSAKINGKLPPKSEKINGLFGFHPRDLDNGGLSKTVMHVELDSGAVINDMVLHNDSLYIAGTFHTGSFRNILIVENGTTRALAGGGLNDTVNTLLLEQDMLYVGGNFTITADRKTSNPSRFAAYSVANQSWEPLGAGVTGQVSTLNPLKVNVTAGSPPETAVVVNGNLGKLFTYSPNWQADVDGLGIWVPSAKTWLQSLAVDQAAYYGQLSSCNTDTGMQAVTDLFCVGSLSSYGLRASGAIGLSFDKSENVAIEAFSVRMTPGNQSRTIAGLFYLENEMNITLLAGEFAMYTNENGIIRNIAIIDHNQSDTVTGINMMSNSSTRIETLATFSSTLYAGGVLNGTSLTQRFTGIFAFDLSTRKMHSTQPPPLEGHTVEVKSIELRPGTSQLYVGGTFDGSRTTVVCPSVCSYDVSSNTWTRPGQGLTGNVLYLSWASHDTLIAAGNLVVDDQPYSLATFYAPEEEWTPFRKELEIPGTITAISPIGFVGSSRPSIDDTWSSDSTGFWIAGKFSNNSAFLTKWSGTSWVPVSRTFGNGSIITGIEIMQLHQTTAANDYLDSGHILVLTGNFTLPETGAASAILFNGTNLWPLALTLSGDHNPGIMNRMFSEKRAMYLKKADPKGMVVSIAIAVVALMLSIIVVGEVSELVRRFWLRRRGYNPVPRQRDEKQFNKTPGFERK